MTDLAQLIASLRAGTVTPADQPAAADALAGKVAVKPLEWEANPYFKIFTSGEYSVHEEYDKDGKTSGVLYLSGQHASDFTDIDAAKAAAQADYTARILAALEPAPLTVDAALTVPEVRALVDAAKEVAAILQAAVVSGKVRGGDSYRIGGVYLQSVSDALDAADAALRGIGGAE